MSSTTVETSNNAPPSTGAVRGRPFGLTEARKDRVVKAISLGAWATLASDYGGISKSSYYSYLAQGEELYLHAIDSAVIDLSQVEGEDPDHVVVGRQLRDAGWPARDVLLVGFHLEVRLADAQAEVRAVALWNHAMPDDWRACRDFLARRHPERWSERAVNRRALEADLDQTYLVRLTPAEFHELLTNRDLRDLATELLTERTSPSAINANPERLPSASPNNQE